MLLRASPLIHMINQFRVVWLMGGFGGGKTLGAFTFAHELYNQGRYRYILGNCNSVWTDSPAEVELRDGSFVDAVVILDEAGLFLKMSRDADKFLLGLRKLNITILCPTVLPPSSRLKLLQVQRKLNGHAFGIPLWIYEYRLSVGTQKESASFGIWRPERMFGIYDTLDYPIDDLYLSDWFEYWMETAREVRPEWVTWGPPPKKGKSKNQRNTRESGEDSGVAQFGGELEETIEKIEELQETISFSADKRTKKRS